MHPCVRCVIINCGSDAKHRGPKNAAPAIERAQGRLTVLGWEADLLSERFVPDKAQLKTRNRRCCHQT